jgi:hypothetical protein
MFEFLVKISLLLLIVFGIIEYIIYSKAKNIANFLSLAERDCNDKVARGLANNVRRDRAAERAEWNKMALPIDGPIPVELVPLIRNVANVQVNQVGYKSVAHELVIANENDMSANAELIEKALITAFLLRQLYAGNVKAAQQKIIADTRENAGKPPYIAPGIDKLVGFDKFDRMRLRFEPDAGVQEWLLKRTVKSWGFPRDIQWTSEIEGRT